MGWIATIGLLGCVLYTLLFLRESLDSSSKLEVCQLVPGVASAHASGSTNRFYCNMPFGGQLACSSGRAGCDTAKRKLETSIWSAGQAAQREAPGAGGDAGDVAGRTDHATSTALRQVSLLAVPQAGQQALLTLLCCAWSTQQLLAVYFGCSRV